MVDPSHSFHVADYAVFGTTIAVSIAIGIYYALKGGGQKTTSDYLVGGRKMQFIPVAISLMVSYESSIMMLGLPAEAYIYGIQYWISVCGFLTSQILNIFIVVPLLHPLRITSAYEYLQLRFNSRAIRLLGSFLGILSNSWYMGIVLFGPGIALEAVTGFPQMGSIFIVMTAAVIYTTVGGLKAVIWTDVFQAFVMYAGMFAILIKGTLDVGGAAKVWKLAAEGGRLNFFNFEFDPRIRHTFWVLFFGQLIRGMGMAFNQSTVQRISATRTIKEAKWVMLIMSPGFFFSLSIALYEGIVAYAYYQDQGCDPLKSGKIKNPNQVIPFVVMDIFKNLPGMPGVFLASLFAASLSTLSSCLSSLSALLWTDFIKPCVGEISEVKATLIAKTSVVFFGLLGCGVALLVALVGGPLTQISSSLAAGFGGPLTGLFMMAAFCPWVNSKGALAGGVISLVFSSWLSLGKSFHKGVSKAPWLPPASTAMCVANHSEALSYVTSGPALVNASDHVHLHYSSLANDVLETSTQAAPVAELEGIQVLFGMSYQLLGVVSIFTTLITGSLFSLITGGNKKTPVDPRYLLNFCDRFCCLLPDRVRRPFRFDDYTSVKDEDKKPEHEMYLDHEAKVGKPTNGTSDEDHKPMIPSNEVDVTPNSSSGENGVVQESNGTMSSVTHLPIEAGDRNESQQ